MADQKLKDKTSEKQSSELMKHAIKQTYHPQDDNAEEKTHAGHYAMENCIDLFKLDYDVELIDNNGGKLCGHYPSQIVLMGKKDSETSAIKGKDGQNLPLKEAREELEVAMERSAPSRCRSRFVTPVIYFRGQYVCRSATLAESKELAMKMATESLSNAADTVASLAGAVASTAGSAVASMFQAYIMKRSTKYISSLFWTDGKTETSDENPPEEEEEEEEEEEVPSSQAGASEPAETEDEASGSQYEEYFRIKVQKDKELLKKLNVHHIFDLMVEDAKVKFGLVFSSSEKADAEQRYKDFNLYSFPYPGCEFFGVWNSKKREARGLHYSWNNPQNTAVLNVGDEGSILRQMGIDWSSQREWDLLQITQNYIQALVRLVAEGEQGLLVHCISGWDRTPLFISLLRLSLWADGLIHPSLGPSEILYLTLAYDWYLFGHQYASRKRKGEEILPFCFYMLPNLVDRKYSAFSYAEYPGIESPNKSPTPTQQRSVASRKSTPVKASSPSAKKTSPLAATGQGKAPKSGALSKQLTVPKNPEPSVRYVKGQGGSAKSSPAKATSSPPARPRAKSQSPGNSSVPAKAAASAAVVVETSPKQLGTLTALSLDSPRKRSSDEFRSEVVSSVAKKRISDEFRSEVVSSVAEKVTQKISKVFGTMGELLRKDMKWMLGIHKTPKVKRQTKENVDLNEAEGITSTSEEANKLPPEIVVMDVDEDVDEEVDKEEDPHPELEEGFEALRPDKWYELPERHKRLLTVSYIFHSVHARCAGMHLKQEAEMDQAVKEYAFGSITSSLFNALSWQPVFFFFDSGKPSGSNPDTGEAGAETGETDASETANPEMDQSLEVLETESADPNVVVTGLGAGETGPGTGEAGLGTGETGPGTGETGPNRQTKFSDAAVADMIKDAMGEAGPGTGETGEAGLQTGETGPGTGETGPEMGEAGPGTGETDPGTGEAGLETGETANPEMERSFDVLETESADPNVVVDPLNRQAKLSDAAVADMIKEAMGDLYNEEQQGQGKAGEASKDGAEKKATEGAAKTRENVSDMEESFDIVKEEEMT